VGVTICLGHPGGDCNITETVETGDTAGQIADKNNVDPNTLDANNPQMGPGKEIYDGEVRRVFLLFSFHIIFLAFKFLLWTPVLWSQTQSIEPS
jgi:hypothetical protein